METACKKLHNNWSSSNNKPKEDWFVFSGRAYPEIVQGKNSTKIVTSKIDDRSSFYNDPAIKLSEENMDEFNGTEGMPICVEHNVKDVVGTIHHTWLGDGDKKALKITAQIDKRTKRGKEIIEDIKCGRLKGLSVGYGADLVSNWKTGITQLNSKKFREISLVREPFFENCHLSWSVSASKEEEENLAFKNPNYNSNTDFQYFYCPIEMSAENNSTPNVGQNVPQTNSIPNQAGQDAVPPHEMLGEITKLKNQYLEEAKAKKELEEKNSEKDKRLAYFEQKEKEAADLYATEQRPKYEKYVQQLTATGVALSDKAKKAYERTYCDPAFKEGAKCLDQQYNYTESLIASKKTVEEKLAAAEKDKQQLEQTVAKNTTILNHSRSAIKDALATPSPQDDEQRRKADVNAASGGLRLNQICVPDPSMEEMPFLKAYGYVPEVNVNASAADPFGGGRPYTRTIQAAATHSFLRDEDGELNYGNSARYHNPGYFAWMCNASELVTGDLSDVVTLNASKDHQKRSDELIWEEDNSRRRRF